MKWRTSVLLFGLALLPACEKTELTVSPERKEELRAMFGSGLNIESIPKVKYEDFFLILDAFANDRGPEEYVEKVEFRSNKHAEVLFSDGGMHGGGAARMRKKGKAWELEEKVYFL